MVGAQVSSSTLSASTDNDALSKLSSINLEIIRLSQRFTDNDPSVLALKRERDALRHYIEVTAGGNLSLPGQQPASKEQAQELILQFKELERIARRDVATLDALENSLLSLQLEKASQNEPWELISSPTLLDSPVAPRKVRIIVFGLFGGIFIGCIGALISDRLSGLVFSEDELKDLLPCRLIKHLPTMAQDTWMDAADLLAAGPLEITSDNKAIALVPLGKIPSDQLKK